MTTVVIVDDHPIVRAGMRTILTNTDGITVVAEGARGADALRLVAEYRPDVLVLDVNLPDISGVEVTRKLRAQGTQTAILVLTVHNDRQTVFGLLESGATGYVLKDDALETLVSAVRAVARGGQHLQPDPPDASHAWFDPNLAVPNLRGTWFIGNQSLYSVNGYLFEIPADWANAHASNRYLGTGRYRDGGWSGMGSALFAYRPWTDERGTPPPADTHLPETPLLLYAKSTDTDNIERALDGYQHPDEWEGGAWLTTTTGKSAVLFAGTKSAGAKYWYGYLNPAGAQLPCVDADFVGQFTVCRLANGAPCPPSDLIECPGQTSYRGWWSTRMDAQFIFYDPDDLARVATGQMQSWEPQPYATLELDDMLFLNPAGIEIEMLGAGVQRRYRIGDVAYDRANDLLYVLELFADQAKPVVHVWRVR